MLISETMHWHECWRCALVLGAIKAFWAEEGFSPSIRDIMERTGITSSFVVRYHLLKLEQVGVIKRTPRVARSYIPIEREVSQDEH